MSTTRPSAYNTSDSEIATPRRGRSVAAASSLAATPKTKPSFQVSDEANAAPRTDLLSPYRQRQWTVEALKNELRGKNLPVTGVKLTLIERLERADGYLGFEENDLDTQTPSSKLGTLKDEDWTIKEMTSPKKSTRSTSSSPKRSPTMTRTSGSPSPTRTRQRSLSAVAEVVIEAGPGEPKTPSTPSKATGTPKKAVSTPASAKKPSASGTPKKTPVSSPSSAKKTPIKAASRSPAELAAALRQARLEAETLPAQLGFFSSPFRTIYYFLHFLIYEGCQLTRFLAQHYLYFALLLLLGAGYVTLRTQPEHADLAAFMEEEALWYGKWFLLGVLSSIGLGTGAHTFLLFLGPFIAEVTTAAFTCGHLAFDTHGPGAFLCGSRLLSDAPLTLWRIMNKVQFEAFAWGAGTAFGELPPFFIARASAKAGKASGEMHELNVLASKPASSLSLFERLQLKMFSLVKYLGFWGILACASIPNPLFDLAGLTCGYFLIPFWIFFTATFIGKAFIKAGIQAAFVIVLFSKPNLDFVLDQLHKVLPHYADLADAWLQQQKASFLSKAVPVESFNPVAYVWNIVLGAVMALFLLSTIQSLAKSHATSLLETKVKALEAAVQQDNKGA